MDTRSPAWRLNKDEGLPNRPRSSNESSRDATSINSRSSAWAAATKGLGRDARRGVDLVFAAVDDARRGVRPPLREPLVLFLAPMWRAGKALRQRTS